MSQKIFSKIDFKKLTKLYLDEILIATSTNHNKNLKRLIFELSIFSSGLDTNSCFIDVGGGDGLLSGLIKFVYPNLTCYVIDDYKDNWYKSELINYLKGKGIIFVKMDASRDISFLNQITQEKNIAIISCLHSIEHWQVSPNKFLEKAYLNLTKNGKLVLAFPNNANLKKRLLAIQGQTSWTNFDYWYNCGEFRGHVREPNIKDLKLISSNLGCKSKSIYGRNFMGSFSSKKFVRFVSIFFDYLLRMFPSLCSDLYIVMNKE